MPQVKKKSKRRSSNLIGANTGKADRVTSVKDYVEVVCRIRDQWIEGPNYFDPWFRGQEDINWALEPNIFRLGLSKEEDEIRGEFRRKAPQYMTEQPPPDYWGWYILMQHYGAPTRLLDWTDSALVALFFALRLPLKPPVDEDGNAPPEEPGDAVVWMLDPWWLNRSVTGDESLLAVDFDEARKYLDEVYESTDRFGNTVIKPRDPVAVDPQFLARRIAVQRSHFTIFGHSRDGLMRLTAVSGSRLVKIALARENAPRMRADLLTLGISDTSIYPDLKGLSDELTRYRLGTWPPD